MHVNRLASVAHDLDVRMHPFQAPQHLLDRLAFGRFGKNAQDRNDALWCVPLSMELMIGGGMFYLAFECAAMDQQA